MAASSCWLSSRSSWGQPGLSEHRRQGLQVHRYGFPTFALPDFEGLKSKLPQWPPTRLIAPDRRILCDPDLTATDASGGGLSVRDPSVCHLRAKSGTAVHSPPTFVPVDQWFYAEQVLQTHYPLRLYSTGSCRIPQSRAQDGFDEVCWPEENSG